MTKFLCAKPPLIVVALIMAFVTCMLTSTAFARPAPTDIGQAAFATNNALTEANPTLGPSDNTQIVNTISKYKNNTTTFATNTSAVTGTNVDGQFIVMATTATMTDFKLNSAANLAGNNTTTFATNTEQVTDANVDRQYATNSATNVTARHFFGRSTVNDAEIAPVYSYAVMTGRTTRAANLHLRV